jgi:hypothetical protein
MIERGDRYEESLILLLGRALEELREELNAETAVLEHPLPLMLLSDAVLLSRAFLVDSEIISCGESFRL